MVWPNLKESNQLWNRLTDYANGKKIMSNDQFFFKPINNFLFFQNKCGTPKTKNLSIFPLKKTTYNIIISLVIIQK